MMRVQLELPQALLLGLPVGWLLWRYARRSGVSLRLRAMAMAFLVLALSQPKVQLARAGSDLVVVVDRSASMPPGSEARAQELIQILEHERRPGDRLAVLGFGRRPEVEQRFEDRGPFSGFSRPIDPDSSDLAAALERAAELIPAERRGNVLVISDGRETGGELRTSAQRLAARGITVDYRQLTRAPPRLDVAVLSLDPPSAVAEREPFQLTAVAYASEAIEAEVKLQRDGRLLALGKRRLVPGENVLVFRDVVGAAGLVRYRLELGAPGDGLPENNVGEALLRVQGPDQVLLVSRDGGAFSKALAQAGVRVRRVAPSPFGWKDLDGVGAVVLENVSADELGDPTLGALAELVRVGGGGLVMTGGRKSFGEGGYRRSPVEDVLPVTLEVRQEQRRSSLAMVIVMDCSGSMSATVPDGRTKMQLAGEGAVAAITLLGPQDEVAVHDIDTGPHEIIGLRPVTSDLPLDRVVQGYSGGGGILIGVALRDARDVILASKKATRHVVLFADASDSTDPEDYREVLDQLRRNHVTVSVIGMGSESDSDAPLLKEVAKRGGGRVYFAQSAGTLPRVFSEETLVVARSAFVDQKTGVRSTPDLSLLGAVDPGPALQVSGYNLAYARAQAGVGMRSVDENAAPLLAFQPAGAGRTVAFTAEVDGSYTGELRRWSGYAGLLGQMVRWSLPQRTGEGQGWTARAVREGSDLHVTVDFGEGNPPTEPPPVMVILSDGQPPTAPLALRWEGEGRMGARLPMQSRRSLHPVVRLGEKVVRLPPVTLPYSPEFAPARGASGREALELVAKTTGGAERTSVAGLFRDAPESEGFVGLTSALMVAALLAALGEVFVRRAILRAQVRKPAAPGAVRPAKPGTSTAGNSAGAASPDAAPAAGDGPAKPPTTGVEEAMAAVRRRRR